MCGKPEQTLFSRSSSTSGTDSSIRIRKGGTNCTERRWFVCVSLAMVFTIVVASAGIYFGCELTPTDLSFLVEFSNQGLSLAGWSETPDWELRSKVEDSILNRPGNFLTPDWRNN